MEESKALNEIQSELTKLEKAGHQDVSVKALQEYISKLKDHTSNSQEFRKMQFQGNIEKYKEDRAEWRELFKATSTTAHSALRTIILINGGAAVALLAFLGKVWGSTVSHIYLDDFAVALFIFVCGVLSAALSTGFTYLSQHCYTYHNDKFGNITRAIANAMAACAYIAFGWGGYVAFLAFTTIRP